MATQKQIRIASHDEGFEGWTSASRLTHSSAVRWTGTGDRDEYEQATSRTRSMSQRASRPEPARGQSDPTTNGDPRRLRPATDRQRMVRASRRSATATQAQSLTAKTYLPVEQEKVGNRQQRRQAQWLEFFRIHPGLFIGLALGLLISLLVFLWFLASLVHMLHQNDMVHPAEFGAAHSTATHLVDHQHRYYLLGSNDQGQSYIMLIPDGQPEHAKLLVGPHIPKDAYIRLSVKDVNGDGSPDIIEEIVPPAGLFLFEQQPLSAVFLNDGHDNFKAQP
ncbi:hypothetical protein KDH_80190 [Dictyobacter sp. S3.2.2.5]|uniref:VCBS repeat-containing protein n=1 Tax=Dictyobacter halimunensis TaxID=3026934 RepID=A0ABQ6G5Q8_9CHLR|nr:hypothetical protein KDH_80190 [Dictyobacter sp. S3.2.2.5]